MTKTRILIFGCSGMLGHKILQKLCENKNFFITCIYRNQKKIKFLKKKNIKFIKINKKIDFRFLKNLFHQSNFDYVINCLGVIKQKNNTDKKKLFYLNSEFPQKLAKYSQIYKFRFIHFSTDCVFSGKKGFYKENDTKDARDIYGTSKSRGEPKETNKNVLTLRTSFIGHEINSKDSLLDWFVFNKNKIVKGYNKAYFNGLTNLEISKIINQIILKNYFKSGLFHLSGHKTNKYNLLNQVNKTYKLNKVIYKDNSIKIDRSLSNKKFYNNFKFKIKNWQKLIKELNDDYKINKKKLYLK